MYSKQTRPKENSSSTHTAATNQFAPPKTFVQPQTQEGGQQNEAISAAEVEKIKAAGSNWPDVSMFTTNRPAPAPHPRIQTKLNIGGEQEQHGKEIIQQIDQHSSASIQTKPLVNTIQRQSEYRPNIRHDHGHLDDGHGNIEESKRREATWSDRAALAYWTAKLNAAETLRPDLIDGTAAYRHFLFGGGKTRTIDYERFIKNDASGQKIIQSAGKEILDQARERHNQFLQGYPNGNSPSTSFDIRTDAIPVGSGNPSYPYPKTENWQKAIGAHIIWLEAHVKVDVNSATKTRTFNIQMTLKMEDMYNFNPGAADLATGTPDSDNGRFEVTGLAQEYLNKATVTRKLTVSEPVNSTSSSSNAPHVNNPRTSPRPPRDGRGTGRR